MLKVGIIGSGFGLYGLLPAFRTIKGCKVVSICGKKTDRLLAYCGQIGLKNLYTDWQQMLEKEDLDVVALAVTPGAQYVIAKAAIQKNIDVWAEKPLATTYKQAVELYNLAKKHKVVHTVDFIFPEIAEWQMVKKMLVQQVYGKLKHIAVDWDFLSYDIKNRISSWKTNSDEGGGALAFYFSHTLHYLEYFAGEIVAGSNLLSFSKESKNGGEVGVDLLLNFKNGVSGNARIRIDVRGFRRHQLVFTCETGTIILENNTDVTKSFAITVYTENKQKTVRVKKDMSVAQNEDERVVMVRKLAARFIKGCLTRTPIKPSFEDGTRVQDLIEKIKTGSL